MLGLSTCAQWPGFNCAARPGRHSFCRINLVRSGQNSCRTNVPRTTSHYRREIAENAPRIHVLARAFMATNRFKKSSISLAIFCSIWQPHLRVFPVSFLPCPNPTRGSVGKICQIELPRNKEAIVSHCDSTQLQLWQSNSAYTRIVCCYEYVYSPANDSRQMHTAEDEKTDSVQRLDNTS